MALGRKIARTFQDEGALSALRKICAGLLQPVFAQTTYRIYRIRLPVQRQEYPETLSRFRVSVLDVDDMSSQLQIETQAEWLRGAIRELHEAGSLCVIATEEDRVVGFNFVSFGDVRIPVLGLSRHFRKGEAWSDSIYVHKDYRGHGLAVALRAKVFQELQRREIRKLYGGTVPSNGASLSLATKTGFTQFATVRYRKLMQRRSWRVRRFRECTSETR